LDAYDKIDFDNSVSLVNDFFSCIIMPNLNDSTYIIKVKRKGTIIFNEQAQQIDALKMRYCIEPNYIEQNGDIFEGKSILIFDDSIEDGETIKPILEKIKLMNLEKINVCVLLAREDSLIALRRKYPQVNFHSAKIERGDSFTSTYGKIIWPYLDYIHLPIQDEHPLIEIDFSGSLSQELLCEFLKKYGEFSIDRYMENYVNLDDRFKGIMILTGESLKIILACQNENPDVDDVKFKLRVYYRRNLSNEKSTLILQPILLEAPEHINKNKLKNKIIKKFLIDDFIFKFLCNNAEILHLSIEYH
jgi:hypothetical protein